jgi:hypothetical protein
MHLINKNTLVRYVFDRQGQVLGTLLGLPAREFQAPVLDEMTKYEERSTRRLIDRGEWPRGAEYVERVPEYCDDRPYLKALEPEALALLPS